MNWETFTLRSLGAIGLLVLLLAVVPVNAQSEGGRNPGRPSSLNYVEGQVSIGTQAMNDQAVGSAKLEPGQSVETEQGKTEMLLTPGVFLRLGENTSVKMISSSLTNTQVLPQVLPVVDKKVGKWPRTIQTAILTFLLDCRK